MKGEKLEVKTSQRSREAFFFGPGQKKESKTNKQTEMKAVTYKKCDQFGIWTPNSLQILAFLVNRIGASLVLSQSHSMLHAVQN